MKPDLMHLGEALHAISKSKRAIIVPCATTERRDQAMALLSEIGITPESLMVTHAADGDARMSNGSTCLFWIIREWSPIDHSKLVPFDPVPAGFGKIPPVVNLRGAAIGGGR